MCLVLALHVHSDGSPGPFISRRSIQCISFMCLALPYTFIQMGPRDLLTHLLPDMSSQQVPAFMELIGNYFLSSRPDLDHSSPLSHWRGEHLQLITSSRRANAGAGWRYRGRMPAPPIPFLVVVCLGCERTFSSFEEYQNEVAICIMMGCVSLMRPTLAC